MRTSLIISLLFLLNIFPGSDSSAQSPYYSLNLSIMEDPGSNEKSSYKVYHRLCYPVDRVIGDFFTNDTSKINWADPSPDFLSSLRCLESSMIITDSFEYSDQVMMYEMIVNLVIIKEATEDTMQIVFPVKIKSFVTGVDLENIPFKKGIYEIDNGLEYSLDGMRLRMKLRDDYKWKALGRSILLIE